MFSDEKINRKYSEIMQQSINNPYQMLAGAAISSFDNIEMSNNVDCEMGSRYCLKRKKSKDQSSQYSNS
jgi:hypothetical protein